VLSTEKPFRFLDLSAGTIICNPYRFQYADFFTEFRNRVYYFATEDCNTREYAVEVFKTPASAKLTKPYAERTWKFFALTQICKQIRAEYRPLWMRAAAFCFRSINIGNKFIETFMPSPADLKHAPKLIQIAWDNDMDYDMGMRDTTQLLRLHSFCPESRCQFVPEKFIDEISPIDDICNFCMEYELEAHGMESDRNMFEGCTCPPFDLDDEEWTAYYTGQLHHLDKLLALLHSTNDAWLNDLREGKMTVHFAFSGPARIKFRVLHNEQICPNTSDNQPAWDLLDDWGVSSLLQQHCIDFVLAYEELQKFERRGYAMTASVVREVCCVKATTPD
jgi:hypothetical protein